jgi:hypothetical protein
MKPGCEYSSWNEHSTWKSFYHEEGHSNGSGPSKTSQKLALWYPGVITDWPYLALLGITLQDIIDHYQCTQEEAMKAMEYIFHFQVDVESRFK